MKLNEKKKEKNENNEDNKKINRNVKITNITNIILNVKNVPKSFNISNNKKDFMIRDIKSLNMITQRALNSNTKTNSLIDSFDNDRKSFLNFKNNCKRSELYINDNSDFDNKELKMLKNDKNNIINIININNNYSLEEKLIKNSFRIGNNKENNNLDSYKSHKTKLVKLPFKSNFIDSKKNYKNMSLNNYLQTMKNDKNVKKEKFISVEKMKKKMNKL